MGYTMTEECNPKDYLTTDFLFDYFFNGLFKKPHEHKVECIYALYGATLEKLDKITNALKRWYEKEDDRC